MSQADLNRVREDLATIQHAARLELPFGKEDVRTSLWSAVCGLFITLWAVFGPWEYRWVVLVPLVAAVVMTIRARAEAQRLQTRQPVRWREHRLSGKAALVAAPVAIGYLYWERWIGMPREFTGAASVFFCGLGALVFSVLDRRRLYYAGGAILMAFGAAIPHCSPQQVIIAGGLCWTVGGLVVAGIQTWQLQQVDGTEHGAD